MKMADALDKIRDLLDKASEEIPDEVKPDLPPGEYTSGAPKWYGFEHRIWAYGEDIRQVLLTSKALRKDKELQDAICKISCDPRAKRGRQSFIMLLGFAHCAHLAPQIAAQIDDSDVRGHVISTISKMRCGDYVELIGSYTTDKVTWIRNGAKKYVKKYQDG